MNVLGVDIGGTFTDFVLLRDGQVSIHKLPSTPADPANALLQGMQTLGAPHTLVHGTTVATNALLERRGAATALLTTAGFADVLALGRGTRPALYDLDVQQAAPLVPAAWRLEIPERISANGSIEHPLDETALAEAIQRLVEGSIEAVAVCYLHSYLNPDHEQRTVRALAALQRPDGSRHFFVSSSAMVLPEYREYERTSTTVVNAYVAPVLDRYLGRLEEALAAQGVASLRIMASDGGSMTARGARALAARTTLSGPAGGVVGARAVAQQAGFAQLISFDMGGTSSDVALCAGALPQTNQSHVGGMPVRLPGIDIHTVGAGGGSLARVDEGGALRVGPRSAGAEPGPACYGRGTLPTVTDANLVLGRLQADAFLGGTMTLDAARAEAALQPVAQAMGLDIPAAALGVVRVVNAAMERAIRTISVERGHDPRDFVLVAFGGAGPLHAAYLAEALGMRRVLVPRYPGVLSALGMLTSDITRDYVSFLARPLERMDAADLWQQMYHLAEHGLNEMQRDTDEQTELQAVFTLDLRYTGQSHEISTPLLTWGSSELARLQPEVREPALPADILQTTAQRFHHLHEQQSGHALPQHPVESVALRLKMIGIVGQHTIEQPASAAPAAYTPEPQQQLSARLHAETTQPQTIARYERSALRPGAAIAGPAVIVQFDTTTIVPPGWHARIDQHGHTLLTI